MEVESPSVKRHYDITMSRRTRKQQQQQQQQFALVHQGNYEKPKSAMDDATPPKVETTQTNNNVSIADEVVKEGDESENYHKSLKQLIIGDDHKEAKNNNNSNNSSNNNSDHDHGERGGKLGSSRNSLGEHFTEEEKQHQQNQNQHQHQLQLVRVQQSSKDSLQQGLKFKKLVRRYAKVLGHLMKAKRDPHLGGASDAAAAGKKPVFKLSS